MTANSQYAIFCVATGACQKSRASLRGFSIVHGETSSRVYSKAGLKRVCEHLIARLVQIPRRHRGDLLSKRVWPVPGGTEKHQLARALLSLLVDVFRMSAFRTRTELVGFPQTSCKLHLASRVRPARATSRRGSADSGSENCPQTQLARWAYLTGGASRLV
jgi:hypothetical protein